MMHFYPQVKKSRIQKILGSMLYLIDESVPELIRSGNAQPADYRSLDYLLLGAVDGHHKVLGSRKVLGTLLSCGKLENKSYSAIHRILERIAREFNLTKNLPVYGHVVSGANTSVISSQSSTQRIITFPLRWFDSSAKIQPTILLGEHIEDSYTLKLFAEVATVINNIPYLPIKLQHDHGGGSAIGDILQHHASSSSQCICVVDSDRSCPGGNIGGTAQTVQRFKSSTSYPLIDVMETIGRDLENTLPDLFYNASYGSASTSGSMTNLLKKLNDLGEYDLRNHIDIEKGLRLSHVFDFTANPVEDVFWKNKLPIVDGCLNIDQSAFPCMSDQKCCQVRKSQCTCIILQGNTSNILKQFNLDYGSIARHQLKNWLDDSVIHEWSRIGLAIAGWCCADERLRIPN